MEDSLSEMALRSFGYGRWEAPYWFIGPEQGMGDAEYDSLEARVEAWRKLGSCELSDCREFHRLIGEKRWHRGKPKLQPTWRPLLLLMATVLDRPAQNDALRLYQRDKWGNLNGESCVIELSGLAAPNLMAPGPHALFLKERIGVIRERVAQHNPALVLMYGEDQREHWETIAGDPFPPQRIRRIGQTTFAFTPHPVSWGLTNEYWRKLGLELRRASGSGEPSGR